MTRPHTHAPAPSGSSAPPPGRGPRLSAAHQTRDASAGTTSSRASLDQLLLALSVPRPVSYDLAQTALIRLGQTAEALEMCTDPLLSTPGMAAAAVGLRAGIAFVLDHWMREHRGPDAQVWDTAHAEALTADLTDIARTAAAIRDQIADMTSMEASRPDWAGPVAPPPHHGGHRSPSSSVGASPRRAAAATKQLPPGAARLLVQAAAIVASAGIVSVVCYEAFDTGPAATQPAGESEPSPVLSVPAASRRPAAPRAADTPTPAMAVSASSGTVSAGVSSLQIQLLGPSAAQQRIEAVVFLDTASTSPVTVQLSYRAAGDPRTVTTSRIEAGRTRLPDRVRHRHRRVLRTPGPGGSRRGRAVGEPEHQCATLSRFRIPVFDEGMNDDHS